MDYLPSNFHADKKVYNILKKNIDYNYTKFQLYSKNKIKLQIKSKLLNFHSHYISITMCMIRNEPQLIQLSPSSWRGHYCWVCDHWMVPLADTDLVSISGCSPAMSWSTNTCGAPHLQGHDRWRHTYSVVGDEKCLAYQSIPKHTKPYQTTT